MESTIRMVEVPEALREDFSDIRDQLFEDRHAVLSKGEDLIQGICVCGGYDRKTKLFNFHFKNPGTNWSWRVEISELDLGRVATGDLTRIQVEETIRTLPNRDKTLERIPQTRGTLIKVFKQLLDEGAFTLVAGNSLPTEEETEVLNALLVDLAPVLGDILRAEFPYARREAAQKLCDWLPSQTAIKSVDIAPQQMFEQLNRLVWA